ALSSDTGYTTQLLISHVAENLIWHSQVPLKVSILA
ncbi:hypothetical protein A2U01_0096173, partial [Trifolium medium]|nr:hypothetical protein [Trifolium medium]